MTAKKLQNHNEWLARIKAFGKWWIAAAKLRNRRWGVLLANLLLGSGVLLAIGVAACYLNFVWMGDPATGRAGDPERAKFFATLVGGVFSLLLIYVSYRRATAMEKTADLTEKGNIAERFKTAIEQLSSDSTTIRLGGIYALHHIAATTKDHAEAENYRERVFEILCAYVRETTTAAGYQPRKDRRGGIVWEFKPSIEVRTLQDLNQRKKAKVTPAIEIQTILELLFVRGAGVYAGLAADLTDANLKGANLRKAQLPGAILHGVVLAHSHLNEANLREADLPEADLQNSSLDSADLRSAFLFRADLRGVHAPGVSLKDAHLEEADLHAAMILNGDFQNTRLGGANLSGVSLQGAKNLTVEQIRYVRSLYNTEFPDCLEDGIVELKKPRPYTPQFIEESVEKFYRERNRDMKPENDAS